MDEKLLLKISLFVSMLGIIGLFIVTQFVEVSEYKISELEIGDYVKITGEVVSVVKFETSTFFELEDSSGKIDAVVFDLINLEEGMMLEVEGEVTEYKGKKEIIVDKLKE